MADLTDRPIKRSMISSDSCRQLVAGNYDVIISEPSSFKSVLADYLEHCEQYESELGQPECGYLNEFKLLKEFSRTLKEDKANLLDGELEFNKKKNRYKDIIPFSHTRVILSEDPESEPGSSYINANYIKGPSGSQRAYIACQGPLPCTLDDFWRMIWECNVSVVIMACNENESDKPKCEIYWPEQIGTTLRYANIEVTLMRVRQICSDFLIRKFSVRLLQQDSKEKPVIHNENNNNNLNSGNMNDQQQITSLNNNIYSDVDKQRQNGISDTYRLDGRYHTINENEKHPKQNYRVIQERTICQFHYTTWPDHGVPDSVTPILELVRLVRDVQPAEDKPILVHCSAGCGRTGTICCIDYVWGLLRQGKLDSNFNLRTIISDMRQQRMSMVQTIEQYILCHRAVAALFIQQLKMIDSHLYENLDAIEDEDDKVFDDQDLGPVFI